MDLHRMWTEQCAAVSGIREAFGTQQALNYLIGEKFLDFVEAADKYDEFRHELPAFAARVKTLFDGSELAAYLAPVDISDVGGDAAIVRCASDQQLVSQAWVHLAEKSSGSQGA